MKRIVSNSKNLIASLHRVIAAALFLLLLTVASSRADESPYSISDFLGLEEVGRGASASSMLIWEQAPPYDELKDYGYGHIGTWYGGGFQLRSIDLSEVDKGPQFLFEPRHGVHYGFDSFSPNGRYVAYYGAQNGEFFIGAYDTATENKVELARAPSVDWAQGHTSIWISDHEFLFVAFDGDEQPLPAARGFSAKRLSEARAATARGQLAVDVQTTGSVREERRWKPGRLYHANAKSGEFTLLADGKFETLKVSHDGRFLAALRQGARERSSTGGGNDDWLLGSSQLYLFDLVEGGKPRVVAPDKDVFPETLAWSSLDNQLAFFAWNLGEGVRSGRYHIFDADSQAVTEWPHTGLDLASERERGMHQKPERVVWLNGALTVFARAHDDGEPRFTYRDISSVASRKAPPKADWFLLGPDGISHNLTQRFQSISAIPVHATKDAMVVLADGDLWRISPSSEPQNLTASVSGEIEFPRKDAFARIHRPFGEKRILVSREEEHTTFVIVDFASDIVKEIESPAQTAKLISGSVDAGALLFRLDHKNGVDLILKRFDGREQVVDRLNSHLENVAKSRWATFAYDVEADNETHAVNGCILLPPNFETGKRYPVMVEVYPSRNASCSRPGADPLSGFGRRGAYNLHLLAAQGYIVFKPNTSRDIIQKADGPLSGMPDVVVQGLDALIERGFADAERAGLIGISQGGISALWIASHSDRFKVVVAINSWSDLYIDYFDASYLQNFYAEVSGFGNSAARYEPTAGTDFPLGATPFDDPDVYVRNSPLFRANHIDTPVLLIHSDMDLFSIGQFERMYTALHLQGKSARLIRYWGEGHGPSSPSNIRHMWNEIFQWSESHMFSEEHDVTR